MTQYIIIAIILAACLTYAAIRIYKEWHQVKKMTRKGDFRCAGCAFYEKCKGKNKKNEVFCKKVEKKFGGIK